MDDRRNVSEIKQKKDDEFEALLRLALQYQNLQKAEAVKKTSAA